MLPWTQERRFSALQASEIKWANILDFSKWLLLFPLGVSHSCPCATPSWSSPSIPAATRIREGSGLRLIQQKYTNRLPWLIHEGQREQPWSRAMSCALWQSEGLHLRNSPLRNSLKLQENGGVRKKIWCRRSFQDFCWGDSRALI